MQLHEQVERSLAALGGRYACVVVRMDEDAPRELASINPDEAFPSASLIKVPILLEVARLVEFGLLSWERRYAITDAARVGSDGVVGDLSPDLQPTLRDLAHLMITISDNTASNMLLDLVGIEAVNATLRNLGLNATRVERRFLDFEARRGGRDNWTTAADMALLFSFFCTDLLPGKDIMLRMLLRQNDYSILPAYWGEDIPFAHKTGGLDGIIHDAGILYPPDRPRSPLIIAVLTADQPDVPLARLTLARVGKMIYEAHNAG